MLKIVALAILLAFPTLASADRFGLRFTERFTIPVVPIDATTFEVIEADGAGGQQLWCAAGIFTTRVMGVQRGDLYIKEARGPSRTVPGRVGIVFTTQPVPGAFTTYSSGVRKAGKVASVGLANSLCFGEWERRVRIRLPNGQLVRP